MCKIQYNSRNIKNNKKIKIKKKKIKMISVYLKTSIPKSDISELA